MENNQVPGVPGAIAFGLNAGSAAIELALLVSISAARILQIGLESASSGLSKYVELSEQELKRSTRRESVKVE